MDHSDCRCVDALSVHSPFQIRPAFTLVELLVVIGVIGLLICLLLPAKRTAREAARRNQCMSQMRQIALSVLDYAEVRGGLPSAYTVDADGKRLHSWRTQILPQMDEQELHASIDFAKPWDAPENAMAAASEFGAYHCPSDPDLLTRTTYLAILTPESALRATEQRRIADIKDGTARTLLAIEVAPDYGAPWMSPSDVDETTVIKHRGARHDRVFGTLFADGHVEMMRDDITDAAFQSLITIAGNDHSVDD